MAQEFILSPEKKVEMEQELAWREGALRQEIIQKIKEARAQGDLSENAEYSAAREEQGHNEGRVKELKYILEHCSVVEKDESQAGTVTIGSTVCLSVKYSDEDEAEETEYTIVGVTEADPRQGRISNESPVGKALLGKKAGDVAAVETDWGTDEYTVLEVK